MLISRKFLGFVLILENYKLESYISSPISSVLWLCKLFSGIAYSQLLASSLVAFSISIFRKNDLIMDTFEICILTVISTELSIKHPANLFVQKKHEQILMGK